jgi:hypothetical protein
MKKKKISSPPIPLEEAKQQAANWRSYCKKLLEGLEDLRIVTDLAKDDSGHDVAGLRIYFRLEKSDSDLGDLQAMIVPVIHIAAMNYLQDYTHLRKSADTEDTSLVYDFTKPCPTECDSESLLCE